MTISARARRDAAEQEDVSQQWRDWCAYLRAQLRLLEVSSASVGRVAFEHEESWEEAEAAAQADLDAIPMGRRALFEAIRTTRRQQIQYDHELAIRMNGGSRRLIDPDVVDGEALSALLHEAEGSTSEDGWGQVPLGTPEQPEWYRVDVAALRDAPSAALYMLGQSAAVDRKRRLMLMGGLASGCLLLLLAWALWPAAPSRPHTSALVLANGAAIEHVWVPQTLLLHASATQPITLPISSTTALSWPEAERTEQQALWRVSTALPLTFCVPQAALPGVTEVQIISAGGAPARRYLLQDNGAGDLRLESCSANHAAALVRYGTLP